MTRVTDQVKTNTQLFLDELWKHSDKGKEAVSIDYDYFGSHCLVAVKRKEVDQ